MMWLIACSGPGAMKVIEKNERFGWILFLIAVGIAVATLAILLIKRKRSKLMYVMMVFTLLHPGLVWGARKGDCGHLLDVAAPVGTALVGLFALVALFRGFRRKPELVV